MESRLKGGISCIEKHQFLTCLATHRAQAKTVGKACFDILLSPALDCVLRERGFFYLRDSRESLGNCMKYYIIMAGRRFY